MLFTDLTNVSYTLHLALIPSSILVFNVNRFSAIRLMHVFHTECMVWYIIFLSKVAYISFSVNL
jgi:hypothetical protein